MSVPSIVASNTAVLWDCTQLQNQMNAGKTLRLYQNAVAPTPGTALAAFTECTFPGYAGVNLAGDFAAPIKIIDGEYQSNGNAHTFSCTGGAGQQVWGFYIDDGVDWWFANEFTAPLFMVTGASFTLQVLLQVWALSIVP